MEDCAADNKRQKGPTRWRHHAGMLVVTSVGVVLTLVVCEETHKYEQKGATAEFVRLAENETEACEQAITDSLSVVESVRSFYDASVYVDRDEFTLFVTPYLARSTSIRRLEWIPFVPDEERSKFELLARRDGMEKFQFRDRAATGQLTRSPKRDKYYPMYYVEPYVGNEHVLGLDLADDPEIAKVLILACETGQAVVADAAKLKIDIGTESGARAFLPVYDNVGATFTAGGRRENLKGYIGAVLEIAEIVERAGEHLEQGVIELELWDTSDAEPRLLYSQGPQGQTAANAVNTGPEQRKSEGLRYEKTIYVGQRQWLIRCQAASVFADDHSPIAHRWLLLVGMAFTVMLVLYLGMHISRAARVERLVTERTKQLDETNRALADEVLQRKQAGESLQKSEQRYRTLFAEAIDGICLADAETGIIIDCNEAMAGLVGRDRAELVGQHQKILHPPTGQDSEFTATFKQHLGDKDKQVLDARIITSTGEIREVEIKASRLHLLGKTVLLGTFRDVTERRKAEKLIAEANAKLSESNRQLQEFTYVVSHDLREPTRKITAFGQLLGESLCDRLNEDEKENLRYMIDGADRMQQMVEAVLEYSRVTTKGGAFEPVDLSEIVEQLKGFELAVSVEETGAIVLVPEPLPSVRADPAQVRQLLQNLISNAIKYRRKDVAPEVIIHAKAEEGAIVRIGVQDNGIGIKQEQLGNLFVMFRQLHKCGEYEGMGIGLAVCKRIVERHGGRIGVESVHGQGSTFWFTLPAASTAKNQPEPALSVSDAAVHG